MRKFLLALGIAPLLAGTAVAGEALSDNQMDRVTAGLILPGGIQMPPVLPDKQIFLSLLPSTHTPFPYGINVFEWLGLSLPVLPGAITAPGGPPAPS